MFIESEKAHAISAPKVKDIFASNITSNLKDWERDLAVVFYAPWCKYCKQLMPSWEAIAGLMTSNDLAVTKLNCESPADNVDLCKSLNVDRYPTVMFFGYGNFNQGPKDNPVFGKPQYPQMVRYNADLYPEAIYDWVQFLAGVSGMKRKVDDFVGFFTGKSLAAKKLASLAKRTQEAERKAYLFGQELERYKAMELFDSLEDFGDPFPLLNQLEPDDVSEVFTKVSHMFLLTPLNFRLYFLNSKISHFGSVSLIWRLSIASIIQTTTTALFSISARAKIWNLP